MRTKSSSRDITSSVTCGGGVRLTGTAGRSLQPRKRSTLGDHRSRRDHKSRSRHDHHKPTLTGTANLAGARCGLSSATGCALLAYRTGRASRSAWAAQSHAPGLWYFPGRVRFSGKTRIMPRRTRSRALSPSAAATRIVSRANQSASWFGAFIELTVLA